MSMPIVATAVPKMPPTFAPSALRVGLRAEPVAGEERDAIVIAVTKVVSKPTASAEMMFVAGRSSTPRRSPDRPERAGRVVLGDVDEGDAGGEADDAGAKK
jgi:hypothetical protein